MTLISIIGCGTHAQHHAKHCGDSACVVGVWDPDPKAAESISCVCKFRTIEDLLADIDTEAVMICSPDEFHLEQIEMALAAGKHVFCEKPLLVPGQSIERLEVAFNLAKEKGLALTSCHPRRYDRPFWWLDPMVSPRSGNPTFLKRFGKVVGFDFDFSYHKPSNEWKNTRSLLLDHLNHEVDLMNSLFGIQGFDAWRLHDGFDQYEVVGKRDDGIAFHFRGTRRLDAHIYPEWCRVRFERGEVALDMMMGVAHITDHERKTVEMIGDLAIDYDGRLSKVMKDFAVHQIEDGQEGYLSRAEMLMNTEAGIVLSDQKNVGVQRINIRI